MTLFSRKKLAIVFITIVLPASQMSCREKCDVKSEEITDSGGPRDFMLLHVICDKSYWQPSSIYYLVPTASIAARVLGRDFDYYDKRAILTIEDIGERPKLASTPAGLEIYLPNGASIAVYKRAGRLVKVLDYKHRLVRTI